MLNCLLNIKLFQEIKAVIKNYDLVGGHQGCDDINSPELLWIKDQFEIVDDSGDVFQRRTLEFKQKINNNQIIQKPKMKTCK